MNAYNTSYKGNKWNKSVNKPKGDNLRQFEIIFTENSWYIR